MKWQQQKSLNTHGKLLRATLVCLERDGFHELRQGRVAQEAGVSKGALTHHFASKDVLLAEAMALCLDNFLLRLQESVRLVRAGELDLDDFLEGLWLLMSNHLYTITLEMAIKARHEPEFKADITPCIKRFHTSIDNAWQQLFPELPPEKVVNLLNLTMNMLRGMGTQSVFRDDPSYFRSLLDSWKKLFKEQLSALRQHHCVEQSIANKSK